MCTYLRRALLESIVSELGIGIATPIFGLTLNAFWKRAIHMFRGMHVYIYIYTYGRVYVSVCIYTQIYIHIRPYVRAYATCIAHPMDIQKNDQSARHMSTPLAKTKWRTADFRQQDARANLGPSQT